MSKIRVDDLIIEVGRKCTRECAHCLRGCGEDKKLNFETFKKLVNQVDEIGTIVFTGGEPALYGKEIAKMIYYLIENGKNVEGFYIATNGEIYSNELMGALIDFYAYIEENFGIEEWSCQYEVSNDQFHSPKKSVVNKLKAFSFYSERSNIPDTSIICEGFAKDTYAGYGRELKITEHFRVQDNSWQDEEAYEVEMLYLNALGKILNDCNYSFETQRRLKPVDIKDIVLFDFIKQYV